MKGAVLLTYSNLQGQYIDVIKNSSVEKRVYYSTDNSYSMYVEAGDVVTLDLSTTSNINTIDVTRRNYTTDNVGYDYGIVDTFVTGTTGSSVSGHYTLTFTVPAASSITYDFEYLIEATSQPNITPTPTVTPTPTNTPAPCFNITEGATWPTSSLLNTYGVTLNNDGTFFLNGTFDYYDTYKPIPASFGTMNVALLNQYGARNTSYTGGTFTQDSGVNKVLSSTGSTILVGGNFTKYYDSLYNGISNDPNTQAAILRITSNGTRDTVNWKYSQSVGFKLTVGVGQPSVYDMVELNDGSILAVGSFNKYSDSTDYDTRGICKLTSNGSFVTSGFNQTMLEPYPNQGYFRKLKKSDTSLFASGYFRYYRSTGGTLTDLVNNANIIKLDLNGNRDTSFIPYFDFFDSVTGSTSSVGVVNDFAIQSDGKIICVGNFITYSGTTVPNGIIRLNSNGTKDTSFSGFTSGFNGVVNSIDLQSDGKIICGGEFQSFNGVTKKHIVRLNTDGSIDNTFITPTTLTFTNYRPTTIEGTVNSVKVDSVGNILVTGQFDAWNSLYVGNFAMLNSTGNLINCSTNFPTPTPSITPTNTPTPS